MSYKIKDEVAYTVTARAAAQLAAANSETMFLIQKVGLFKRHILKEVPDNFLMCPDVSGWAVFNSQDSFIEAVLEGCDLPIAEKLLRQFFDEEEQAGSLILDEQNLVGVFADEGKNNIRFEDNSRYLLLSVSKLLRMGVLEDV